MGILFILFLYTPDAEAAVIAERLFSLEAGFDQPSDVAVSSGGDAYVLDGLNGRVVVFGSSGDYRFTFPVSDAYPTGIAADGNRVYVADTGNHRIMVFDEEGRELKDMPLQQDSEPVDLLISDETVTWSDRKSHKVCRSDAGTGRLLNCWGGKGSGEGMFRYPSMLAADKDGYIHVADVLNARVQYFNAKGRYFGEVSGFGLAPGSLVRPNGIAFDGGGRLYVSDLYTGRILVFKDDAFKGELKDRNGKAVEFKAPSGLAAWKDRLYVTEMGKDRVEVFRMSEDEAPAQKAVLDNAPRKECVTCHISWHPLYKGDEKKVLPEVAPVMCYSCHQGSVIESRKAMGKGDQHPNLHYEAKDKEKAKKRREERGDKVPAEFPLLSGELYCGSCHTPHNKKGKGEKGNDWMRVSNREREICGRCHESYITYPSPSLIKRGQGGVNHPIGIYLSAPPAGADRRLYASTERLQKGLPEKLAVKGAVLDSKKRMVCESCHGIHGTEGKELLVMKNDSEQLCMECHEDIYLSRKEDFRKRGVHPVGIRLEKGVKIGGEDVKEVRCLTCHSVHDGKADTHLLRKDILILELCAACHERHSSKDRDDAGRKGIHPVNMKLEKVVKIGKKEVLEMDCFTCHSIHKGKPGTPSLVEEYRDGEICEHCHKGMKEVVETDHDLRVMAKESENRFKEKPEMSGVCGACHSMHRGKKDTPFLYAGKPTLPSLPFGDKNLFEALFSKEGGTKRDRLCLDCHSKKGIAEKKTVEDYAHPYKDVVLRSSTSIFPLYSSGKKSEFGNIRCVTCHDPHRWRSNSPSLPLFNKEGDVKANREGTVLNSFLRRKDVKGTFCVDCHGTETMVKYRYYHSEKGKERAVDYIR